MSSSGIQKRMPFVEIEHTGALHHQNISDLGKDDPLGLGHPAEEDFPIVGYLGKDFARSIRCRHAALVKKVGERRVGDGLLSDAP